MADMFYFCYVPEEIDLSGSFSTAEVTDTQNMFYQCKALKKLDLRNFNTENVTRMTYIFNKNILNKE